MMTTDNGTLLESNGSFSALDRHFAKFMTDLAGTADQDLSLAAALVSRYTRQGHICLDIKAVAGSKLPIQGETEAAITFPNEPGWSRKLQDSPIVGKPGDYRPLILDQQSRLYLYRYWDYQDKLAHFLQERLKAEETNLDLSRLQDGLKRFFPEASQDEIDWQKVAVFVALKKKLCIISGGPGTGKTTTVAKILSLLLEQAEPNSLNIVLAAPTGKAAARLQETINKAKENLNCSEQIKTALPDKASTIHRLLGSKPGSPYFYHNADNQLLADVVVVDEASMIALPLMSKLVQALSPQTRLILLGDKDQLASVEPGKIFGDICAAKQANVFSEKFITELQKLFGYQNLGSSGKNSTSIQDCTVQLKKNYRFDETSGIRALSQAVNNGNGSEAMSILTAGNYPDIKWQDLPAIKELPDSLKNIVTAGFKEYLLSSELSEIFRLFEQFRILCALREGPLGVTGVNELIERILTEQQLIRPYKGWYPGRPILITSNDYNLRLFNGDVGIILRDNENGNELRAFFPTGDGNFRKFSIRRLPEHETAYAMTIHKSQGSEFGNVVLLLPAQDSPIMTRELIYTGITRAKKRVEIWGEENIFRLAVNRYIERSSGLREAMLLIGTESP